MTTVLVAYASFHGATAGLAGWIADEMRSRGVDAWAVPAAHISTLEDVDAVVIGSAVYVDRWVRDASDLVNRQADALKQLPVWLFSSGVVGGGNAPVIPDQQKELAALVGARGSVAFGGALDAGTDGPVAGHLVDVGPGDWRDEHAVRAWAREIAAELAVVPSAG
jgi:menaquinone-dependent protoporphyrinogen oxidase